MRFCDVCENMMFLSLSEEDKLHHRCKNCGHEVEAIDERGGMACVLDKNYIDDETKYRQFVNPNIKYDPTLPRVSAIQCSNPACTKPAGQDNEVIYLKYDRVNLKYMYYCCFCETFWKSR